MCTRVWDDQTLCENQGALATYLNVEWKELPLDHRYTDEARGPGICLCPINVEKALRDAGKTFEYDRGDPMEIMVAKTI